MSVRDKQANGKCIYTYYDEDEYILTKACIEIMRESFKHGTRFIVPNIEYTPYTNGDCRQRFKARRCHVIGFTLFKVTNDERRRLLPILEILTRV